MRQLDSVTVYLIRRPGAQSPETLRGYPADQLFLTSCPVRGDDIAAAMACEVRTTDESRSAILYLGSLGETTGGIYVVPEGDELRDALPGVLGDHDARPVRARLGTAAEIPADAAVSLTVDLDASEADCRKRPEEQAAPVSSEITRASVYYDRQDPAAQGWAWKYTDSRLGDRSGPVDDGELGESAELADVLDAVSTSDFPAAIIPPGDWRKVDHDGPGWEWSRE